MFMAVKKSLREKPTKMGVHTDTAGERLTGSQSLNVSIPSVSTNFKKQPKTNVLAVFCIYHMIT